MIYARTGHSLILGSSLQAITDITPFILEEVVAAWPDAKFILTTRNEDAWYRSMENTILPMTERTGSPGFTLLKMFNPFLYQLAEMRTALTKSLWGYGNSRDKEAAIQTYRAQYAFPCFSAPLAVLTLPVK